MSEENTESNVETTPEVSASEIAPKDVVKAASVKAEAAAKAAVAVVQAEAELEIALAKATAAKAVAEAAADAQSLRQTPPSLISPTGHEMRQLPSG